MPPPRPAVAPDVRGAARARRRASAGGEAGRAPVGAPVHTEWNARLLGVNGGSAPVVGALARPGDRRRPGWRGSVRSPACPSLAWTRRRARAAPHPARALASPRRLGEARAPLQARRPHRPRALRQQGAQARAARRRGRGARRRHARHLRRVQSNHCRATAFAAAKRGLSALVLLRVPDPARPPPPEANASSTGSPARRSASYRTTSTAGGRAHGGGRARALGRPGARPYVIPEGGSSALGSLGYALAVAELREQLPTRGAAGPLTIAYAVGSAARARGSSSASACSGGATRSPSASRCATTPLLPARPSPRSAAEARRRWPTPAGARRGRGADRRRVRRAGVRAADRRRGSSSSAGRRREDGVLLDPVYTGKAMLGVSPRPGDGRAPRAARRVRPHRRRVRAVSVRGPARGVRGPGTPAGNARRAAGSQRFNRIHTSGTRRRDAQGEADLGVGGRPAGVLGRLADALGAKA